MVGDSIDANRAALFRDETKQAASARRAADRLGFFGIESGVNEIDELAVSTNDPEGTVRCTREVFRDLDRRHKDRLKICLTRDGCSTLDEIAQPGRRKLVQHHG